MKKILFAVVALMAMSTTNVNAETTQSNDVYLSTIYVNEQVTTHLIMPETIACLSQLSSLCQHPFYRSVLGYARISESRCEYVCRRNEPLCHPYL